MRTLKNMLVAACVAILTLTSFGPGVGVAQHYGQGLGNHTVVDGSVQQLELVVGASRRLKFGYKIPELLVEQPDVLKATPIAPNEILISGLKPGVTTITVMDPEKNLQSIAVQVTADTRKLEAALKSHFPDSAIRVHALQTGVILKGTVAKADQISPIMIIAKDYFPTNVVNQMSVDGSQLLAIKVKVYEVSRTKLRTLGVDWAIFDEDFSIGSSVSNIIQDLDLSGQSALASGDTISFGVLGNNTSFFKFIEALEQNNLAKLLDQPTLVAQNGRPAEFLSGGEIPISVASGLGTNSIEFRPFGTKLDIVPLIHGQGEVTLEVRAEVSEVDNSLSFGSGVPGFRVRRVNTGVRMKAGHTLALAGDYREEIETEKRGIPWLMHAPIIGNAFRRVEDTKAESELVFLITPRFISEVDPSLVPRLGPGQLSTQPSNHEHYLNGYIEVPKCNDDCPVSDRFDDPANYGNYPNYKSSMENQQAPMGNQPIYSSNGQGYETQTPIQPASSGSLGSYPLHGSQTGTNNGYVYPNNSGGGGSFSWPNK